MKIVKSWKKNLKRTGALALASLVMMGTAGAVDITLNENGTSDSGSNGNVKTVLGYQTEAAIGYAANISWGNMIFVYDNGTYDPKTGRLIATERLGADTVQGDAKYIDEESGSLAAGNWYGFNGETNSVVIENLSTEEVYVSAIATTTEETSVVGDAKFTLYAYDDHTNDDSTVNCWEGVDSSAEYKVKHNANGLEPTNYYVEDVEKTLSCKWYKHDGTSNFGRTFKASQFNDDGSSSYTDVKAFYLNISGTPGENLQTEFNEEGEPNTIGSELGTITLNFGPSAEYPTRFTPVLPQSNQVNQG